MGKRELDTPPEVEEVEAEVVDDGYNAPKRPYNLYREMKRLADALHAMADEMRASGYNNEAIECYREARELADTCAKFERAPKMAGAVMGSLRALDRRLNLSSAKRRQQADQLTFRPNGHAVEMEDEDNG